MGLWPLKNMAHFPDSINAKYWSVWHKLKCLIQLLRSVIKVGVRGNSLASCTSFFLLMRIQKWQMEIKQPSALNRRATRGKESGTLTLRSTTSALEHLLLEINFHEVKKKSSASFNLWHLCLQSFGGGTVSTFVPGFGERCCFRHAEIRNTFVSNTCI